MTGFTLKPSELLLDAIEHKVQPLCEWVSYDWARACLTAVGCGLRRDAGGRVEVFESPEDGFEVDADTQQTEIGSLFVRDGASTRRVQQEGGKLQYDHPPWREIVSRHQLCFLILKRLSPELASEVNTGKSMGRGFQRQHRRMMISERLIKLGYWPRSHQ